VSPLELETVLLRHPDVIDAAVVGVKDEQVGDLPRGLVVVRRPDVDTRDIVAFVNGWSFICRYCCMIGLLTVYYIYIYIYTDNKTDDKNTTNY